LKDAIPANELNLTSRTELLVNFKRVKLELKKSSFRTRVKKKVRFELESSFEPNQFLSNRAQTGSIRLISSSIDQ